MNVDILIRWGTKVLAYLAQLRQPGAEPVTAEQLIAAYGWLQDFRAPLLKDGARSKQLAFLEPIRCHDQNAGLSDAWHSHPLRRRNKQLQAGLER